MGAVDGKWFSNTLAYERVLHWSGVLIEPNPDSCRKLFLNRPTAKALCSAVSNDSRPIVFEQGIQPTVFAALDVAKKNPAWRKFWHHDKGKTRAVVSDPLGKLLRAVGVAKVDLFSLDVEGAEIEVLLTMDWTIPVRVWCIETSVITQAAINAIMTRHNYSRVEWAAASGKQRIADHSGGLWNDLWVRAGMWTHQARTHGARGPDCLRPTRAAWLPPYRSGRGQSTCSKCSKYVAMCSLPPTPTTTGCRGFFAAMRPRW